jgi:hypothetical protein
LHLIVRVNRLGWCPEGILAMYHADIITEWDIILDVLVHLWASVSQKAWIATITWHDY